MGQDFRERRAHTRRKVLWKAKLEAGDYYFECLVYDISLQGAKVKLDLPLEQGSSANISMKEKDPLSSKVAWATDGYVGLNFKDMPEQVRHMLGQVGKDLN